MHICLGVCGIGKGHSSRQLQLANKLISRGHTVSVLGYGEALPFFRAQGFHIHEVWVPFIAETGVGLSWRRAVKDNYKKFVLGLLQNASVFMKLFLKGYPDIFISDYEPVSARLAYLWGKPLVLYGQQSKFRHWNFPAIGQFNTAAEHKRLRLFFPEFNRSFVASLHPLPGLNDKRIQVIPPPIPAEYKSDVSEINEKNIVVYFSSLFGTTISQSMVEFCSLARKHPEYKFIIYSNDPVHVQDNDNIEIKKINRCGFVKDLKKCVAVISTAGFTLISEAIFLKKPFYAIPLPTYDQNFCAKGIVDQQIGVSHLVVTDENLSAFLESLNTYKRNLINARHFFEGKDPLDMIADYVQEIDSKT